MATTYALLGGTGNVGHSVLKALCARPDIRVNVLVRSKAKLERLDYTIATSPNLTIYEGDISNNELVSKCLHGCHAAFLTVAAFQEFQGCRIAQDQAQSVIKALSQLRHENPSIKLPFLVVLSSAETSPKFFYDVPFPIRWLVYWGLYNIYQDLMAAEKHIRSQDAWIGAVFMKPGAISHDVPRGHALSTEKSQSFVSFLDVGEAMVQLGEEGPESWARMEVSVTSNGNARVEWGNIPAIFSGLLKNIIYNGFR